MRMRGSEYALADLFEEPALSLAIERDGFDRRSLAQLLRAEGWADGRRACDRDTAPRDEFIAE